MNHNTTSYRKKWHPKRILLFAGFALAFAALAGGLVMFLWNAILTKVVDVRPLTYWQAVGLFVLFRVLFGGFFHRFRGKGKRWREGKRMAREKWMNMSEEERHEFKNRWKEHCKKRGE